MKLKIKDSEFMNKVVNNFHKMTFNVKKMSPEILLFSGLTLVCVGTGVACAATVKAHKKIEETKAQIDEAKDNSEDSETYKKEVSKICVHTGLDLLKIYGPAILISSAGGISILASHGIIKKRNAALAAAYTTIDGSFKKYRERVVKSYGEEIDKDLKNGIALKKIDTVETDPETGKEKKKKKTVKVIDTDDKDIFLCRFDNRSREYNENHDYNMMFLRAQEAYLTNVFQDKGYIFQNDIMDALDLPRTRDGQVVGKIYDQNKVGGTVIDLGLVESWEEDENGDLQPVITLNPNMDGPILNNI